MQNFSYRLDALTASLLDRLAAHDGRPRAEVLREIIRAAALARLGSDVPRATPPKARGRVTPGVRDREAS